MKLLQPLLIFIMAMCTVCQSENSVQVQPEKVQLCEVLKHPEKYADRVLKVSARITASIESAGIWDVSCRKLEARLQVGNADRENPSILALYRELGAHGLSDHPLTASLTGVFKYYPAEQGHPCRRVFIAREAAEIRQSELIERR